MKTIPDRKKTSRNLLAFNGGLQLPRPLAFLSHCTRPCHLRDMPKHHQQAARWLSAFFILASLIFILTLRWKGGLP